MNKRLAKKTISKQKREPGTFKDGKKGGAGEQSNTMSPPSPDNSFAQQTEQTVEAQFDNQDYENFGNMGGDGTT